MDVRRTGPVTTLRLVLSIALAGCGGGAETPAGGDLSTTDVLLITLCTLRADHLGTYGGPAGISPEIDALAARGVLFERTLTPAPWTRPALAATVTGLYPRSLGIEEYGMRANDRALDPQLVTLAEHMRAAGYYTIGITGNPNANASFHFDQGYDHYRDTGQLWREGYRQKKQPAAKLVAELLDQVRGPAAERRFFAHLILVDTHTPYRDDVARRQPDPWRGEGPTATYDRQVHYADRVIGELHRTLVAERGRAPLFVLTADHGEAFGRVHRDDVNHGANLYDATLWVPLIVSHPALTPRRVATRVEIVDVAPTLLDLVGVDFDPASFEGRSLAATILTGAPPPERPISVVESGFGLHTWKSALLTDRHKLIADFERRTLPALALFDRAADPDEQHDLAAREPDLAAELFEQLSQWQREHPPHSAVPVRAQVRPDEREALRALGYVE